MAAGKLRGGEPGAGGAAGALRAGLAAARTGAAGPALGVFAVRVAAAGCAYVAQVLMARMMGEAEYGLFAAIWVWIAILGHTATLGLSQGACRFLPADQATGRLDAARGFLLAGAGASAAGGVALTLLGLGLAWGQGSLLAGPYGGPILVGALVVPLFALQDYCEGVARSQGWPLLAIVPPYLLRQAAVMAAMAAAMLAGAPAQAWVAVACTLLATGLATTVQAALLLRRLARAVPDGPRRYRWRLWLGTCLPIAAADLAASASGFVDVVILGILLPPAEVGLYFAATRIQQFVVFVQYATSAATAQRFAAARAGNDPAALDGLVAGLARGTFGATLAIALAVLAAGPLLLGLFGPEFRASLPILAVLVAGSAGASLFGPGDDVLTMLGGERLCAAITVAGLGLAALLCLALVPWLGTLGAALAMAGVTVLRATAMALGARAIHGIATTVLGPGRRAR